MLHSCLMVGWMLKGKPLFLRSHSWSPCASSTCVTPYDEDCPLQFRVACRHDTASPPRPLCVFRQRTSRAWPAPAKARSPNFKTPRRWAHRLWEMTAPPSRFQPEKLRKYRFCMNSGCKPTDPGLVDSRVSHLCPPELWKQAQPVILTYDGGWRFPQIKVGLLADFSLLWSRH